MWDKTFSVRGGPLRCGVVWQISSRFKIFSVISGKIGKSFILSVGHPKRLKMSDHSPDNQVGDTPVEPAPSVRSFMEEVDMGNVTDDQAGLIDSLRSLEA